MSYQLRPYQERAQTDTFNWFVNNHTGHPIVDACVGAGKSLIIADFCKRVLTNWPDQRIIMIVASRELVRQNYERLLAIWPEAPVGVHSAGLRRKDIFESIIFASIGSINKKAMQLGRFDIGLIDECHNINHKNLGMYRSFIDDMLGINPHFRVIGYTGTPFRGNGVWLHKGSEALFTDICTRITIKELLEEGYLSPLVLGKTETYIDASGVDIQAGDYNIKQLAKAADRDDITKSVVSEIIVHGQNRKSWAIYCVDIKHTTHVYEEFVSRGINARMITGKTPAGERDKILDDFKHFRIKAIVNCMVLTVGWDNPATDLIALMRSTKSPMLYIQVAGRGLRNSPETGKENCLWLDFTNTTSNLGPVDLISGRDPVIPKGQQGAPVKVCPVCAEENPAGVRFCMKCEAEFPPNELVINPQASDAAILSGVEPPKKTVTRVLYYRHQKKDSENVSLRVEYFCGMQAYKEWIPIENDSMYARSKADSWWRIRTGVSAPKTVNEALDIIKTTPFMEPKAIRVRKDGKYEQIIGYDF
jgi:DNA repair protein RadD